MNKDFEIMDIKSFKPEEAKKILEENRMQVTLKEAEAILDFVNLIAGVALSISMIKRHLDPSRHRTTAKD